MGSGSLDRDLEHSWPGLRVVYESNGTSEAWGILERELGLPPRADHRGASSQLFATAHAFRCDWFEPGAPQPSARLIQVGNGDPQLLDLERRRFRALPLTPTPAPLQLVPTGGRRRFNVGEVDEFELLLDEERRSILSLWILKRPPEAVRLGSFWSVSFPGVEVPSSYLPVELRLRLNRYDEPAAVMRLLELERARFPLSYFLPPRDFLPEEFGNVTRYPLPGKRPRLPSESPPRPRRRGSILSAVLASGNDELLKLLINDGVVERLRSAVDSVARKVGTLDGEHLRFNTQLLVNQLGQDPVSQALFLRVLLLHFLLEVQALAENGTLRQEFRKIKERLAAQMDATAISPPAGASTEEAERFNSLKELYLANSGARSLVDELLEAESSDARTVVLMLGVLGNFSPGEINRSVALDWFDQQFSEFDVAPTPSVTQKNGKNKGWAGHVYLNEGIVKLIDIRLEINGNSITVNGPNPILEPFTLVDFTQPAFVFLEQVIAQRTGRPRDLLRAGVSTRVNLGGFEIDGVLTTKPTAASPVVAALLILDPSAVAKLFNRIQIEVVLNGVSAGIIVYSEQDRLRVGPPVLRALVHSAEAGPSSFVDVLVLHFSFGPSALLSALISEFNDIVERLLEAVSVEGTEGLSKLLGPLGERIRLQQLLALEDPVRDTAETRVREARRALREAASARDAADEAHREAAEDAKVDPGTRGYNPAAEPKPLVNLEGTPLTREQIDLLEATFSALVQARREVTEAEQELAQAESALVQVSEDRPSGNTFVDSRFEPDGYNLGLSLCAPSVPGAGGALVYPPEGVGLSADLALLVSDRAFHDWLRPIGAGVRYLGPVRSVSGTQTPLVEASPVDWWTDSPRTDLLGPRPTDLRDGPPDVQPNTPAEALDEWRGYWSLVFVGAAGVRLLPINRPSPNDPVAQMRVSIWVEVGVATYVPATYQYCEDVTRLVAELASGGLDLPLDRPVTPGGPRPRPDLLADLEIETGLTRLAGLGDARVGRLVTSKTLENTRIKTGFGDVLFSPRRGFGPSGRGGDFYCQAVTGWDVRDREIWVRAALELEVPVFIGIGDRFFDLALLLAGQLGAGRARFLPLLTYRFDAEAAVLLAPLDLTVQGPLEGLAANENRAWLETLLREHALTLLLGANARYRRTPSNRLNYAYGVRALPTSLSPENFNPRALLTLHPDYWSGTAAPPAVDDTQVPYLAFESFGPNPDRLHLAIKFFTVEDLLGRL